MLLVEQFTNVVLGVADRALVVSDGRITYQGEAATLKDSPEILHRAYLGGPLVVSIDPPASSPNALPLRPTAFGSDPPRAGCRRTLCRQLGTCRLATAVSHVSTGTFFLTTRSTSAAHPLSTT